MKKIIKFIPAYDKKEKNCGIHGVDIKFVLIGELGAIEFRIATGWYLKSTRGDNQDCSFLPSGLTYHSPKPFYENQYAVKECEYLNDKECYRDGSILNSYEVFDILCEKGDAGVWEYLENYYIEKFGGERCF